MEDRLYIYSLLRGPEFKDRAVKAYLFLRQSISQHPFQGAPRRGYLTLFAFASVYNGTVGLGNIPYR